MNFFDCWKTLNTRFDEGDMTAQTQLVGYKLFAIFNERMFPEWLPLTDRELQSRTNIRSGQTIVEARRQLKNAGLIDFKTAKNKPTQYRLTIPIKHESSTNQAPDKHESSTGQARGFVPYTRVREDVKTLDLKTEDTLNTTTTTHVRETLKDITSRVEMDIHEVWEYETGYRLTGSVAYELEELANADFEGVRQAIIAAVKSKTTARVRYNHFRAIYADMLNPKRQSLKGGETSGGIDYGEEPNYSWLYGNA